MIQAQRRKIVAIAEPEAIKDNASWTCSYVDTAGFDYAEIYVHLGATDVDMAACKVQECDTSGGTYADVTGLIFGTSTTIGAATSTKPKAADDNLFFKCEIDLRYRKRYLKPVLTAGDGTSGTYAVCWAELSRAEAMPDTEAEAGCHEILRV